MYYMHDRDGLESFAAHEDMAVYRWRFLELTLQ